MASLFVLPTALPEAQANLIHLKQVRKGTGPIKNSITESFANHLCLLHPKALLSMASVAQPSSGWELGAVTGEQVSFSIPLAQAVPVPSWDLGMLPVWEQGCAHGNGEMLTGTGSDP